jgi:hypothetical protein
MTMPILIKVLNNNTFDNDILFYSILIGTVGLIGYSIANKIFNKNKSYADKGVQTDGGGNLSDSPNPNNSENVSLIDTQTPSSSTFTDTSSLIPTTSEVGTQTIVEDVTPVKIEITPPQDIAGRVVDLSNAEYLAAKAEQLNALDPFSTTPWTPEKVSTLIDTLGMVNNIFN